MSLNAYDEGYKYGTADALNDIRMNPSELIYYFEIQVTLGYFSNFQKIQYLTGYRRAATGQPK